VPFRSDPPVEDMSTTQARGARLWLVESLGGTFGEALRDIPDRDLEQLAADLLATAHRVSEGGNQAADALIGMLWAGGTDIAVLDVNP
jgi:hypothetical protein